VKRVVVVDTGMGNLASVERALLVSAADAGVSITLARSGDPDAIGSADVVVFPGQGAFRDCSRALDGGLREALVASIRAGKPYLGLCLGLQILFVSSEEAPDPKSLGLAIFDGVVRKLPSRPGVKVPHMGWNTVEPARDNTWLPAAEHFYFVHSYAVAPVSDDCVLGRTTHGETFVSAVSRDNVLAVQFHPEKSQGAGLRLLSRFWRTSW